MLGGAGEDEERPQHAACGAPREERREREKDGRQGEHPPPEHVRGLERVGRPFAHDDSPREQAKGRERDDVVSRAAGERPLVVKERPEELGGDGGPPRGSRVRRRDDLARGVDEIGRVILAGLRGRQEAREDRSRGIEARAGDTRRLSVEIHERDEEKEALRAVRERRQRRRRAATGRDRLPGRRHGDEPVVPMPSGRLLPQDLAGRAQKEDAGEQMRAAISGEERGPASGAVGLDASAVEALEVVANDLLDVVHRAAGETLLVAHDAGGEVVEGIHAQDSEDDEGREKPEGDEQERPRLQGISDPEARPSLVAHGFGGVSGAAGAGSWCAVSPGTGSP